MGGTTCCSEHFEPRCVKWQHVVLASVAGWCRPRRVITFGGVRPLGREPLRDLPRERRAPHGAVLLRGCMWSPQSAGKWPSAEFLTVFKLVATSIARRGRLLLDRAKRFLSSCFLITSASC